VNRISMEATPSLWALWWNAIVLLRQAFSRESTYMYVVFRYCGRLDCTHG
jgi:hypothetical protein